MADEEKNWYLSDLRDARTTVGSEITNLLGDSTTIEATFVTQIVDHGGWECDAADTWVTDLTTTCATALAAFNSARAGRLLVSESRFYAQRFPELYEDGHLKPLSVVQNQGLDSIHNLTDDIFKDDWTGNSPIDYHGWYTQRINAVADGWHADLPGWRNGDDEVIEEVRENPTGGRRALWDPDKRQAALYGDNEARYDDRPRPTHPTSRRRPSNTPGYGPLGYEPTEVGVGSDE